MGPLPWSYESSRYPHTTIWTVFPANVPKGLMHPEVANAAIIAPSVESLNVLSIYFRYTIGSNLRRSSLTDEVP